MSILPEMTSYLNQVNSNNNSIMNWERTVVQGFETEFESVVSRFKQLQDDNFLHKTHNNQLESQTAKLQSDLNAAIQQNTSMRSTVNSQQVTLDDLTKLCQSQDDKLYKLTKGKEELTKVVTALTNELDHLKVIITGISAQNSSFQYSESILKDQLQQQMSETEAIKQNESRLSKELSIQVTISDELRQEAKKAQDLSIQLQNQLEEA